MAVALQVLHTLQSFHQPHPERCCRSTRPASAALACFGPTALFPDILHPLPVSLCLHPVAPDGCVPFCPMQGGGAADCKVCPKGNNSTSLSLLSGSLPMALTGKGQEGAVGGEAEMRPLWLHCSCRVRVDMPHQQISTGNIADRMNAADSCICRGGCARVEHTCVTAAAASACSCVGWRLAVSREVIRHRLPVRWCAGKAVPRVAAAACRPAQRYQTRTRMARRLCVHSSCPGG